MSEPTNRKPAARPVSQGGGYHKLPIAEKRQHAIGVAREAAVRCPHCDTQVMAVDLITHIAERCPDELPPAHPASRWLARVAALRYAPSSRLDSWVERGLVRRREDGSVLERDLALVTAWARALEAL